MDIDSPSAKTADSEDEHDDFEDGYNPHTELLELEPLREDSEDEDDINDDDEEDDDDNDNDDNNDNDNDNEQESQSSSEEEEEEQVHGLTGNEREILTLLAVDKKLASLLDLAANALSALRPAPASTTTTETRNDAASNSTPADKPASTTETPDKAFEKASAEYYKALDDIQLTLRNSIHLIRKARISPRTLMDNPSLGSVLSAGPGFNTDISTEATQNISIAPGVVPGGNNALGRGATRMETETWREASRFMRDLLSDMNAMKATKPSSASPSSLDGDASMQINDSAS